MFLEAEEAGGVVHEDVGVQHEELGHRGLRRLGRPAFAFASALHRVGLLPRGVVGRLLRIVPRGVSQGIVGHQLGEGWWIKGLAARAPGARAWQFRGDHGVSSGKRGLRGRRLEIGSNRSISHPARLMRR